MPNTRRGEAGLLRTAAWSHRWAVATWVLGGGAATVLIALGFQSMSTGFGGGSAGFGQAAEATAEAMKPLVGPAYRLDTLGGYLTYHNLGWMAYFVALYALIQGAGAIRGDEAKGKLDLYLATSATRLRVLVERAGGFGAALAVLTAGLGLGIGAAMSLGGSPDWLGALEVAGALGLLAAVFYAAGLLAGQVLSSAGTAAGVTAVAATALYLLSNVADDLGAASWLRFASPFFYYQQSRYALVPGHHADAGAALILALSALALLEAAALLFDRRDLHAVPLKLPFRLPALPRPRAARRSLWTWFLREQPLALAAWFAGAFALELIYVWIYPQVRSVWEGNELVKALIQRTENAPLFDSYLSLTLTLAAIITAAFAVVQGSRWLSQRSQGREELYLAAVPVSRLRLQLERWLALAAGLLLISLGVVGGLWAGAAATGLEIHAQGLVRTAADTVLFGLAVGGASALLVSWLRSGAALAVLGALIAASYLVSVLQLLFRWPDWTSRFSIFEAFGSPYVREPEAWGVAVLAAVAVAGALASLLAFRPRASVR